MLSRDIRVRRVAFCKCNDLWEVSLPEVPARPLFTLHPKPYTLHPTPYTPHPTPYTLHPTPYTLHPKTPPAWVYTYRGTSLIIKRLALGPYSRHMPMTLR